MSHAQTFRARCVRVLYGFPAVGAFRLRHIVRVLATSLAVGAAFGSTAPLVLDSAAHAQPTPVGPAANTVGDLLAAARTGAREAQLAEALPAEYARLERQLIRLSRQGIDTLSLATVGRAWMASEGAARAPLARMARWRTRDAISPLSPDEGVALDTLAAIMSQRYNTLLTPRMSEDSIDALLTPLDAFNDVRRDVSLEQSLEKLRRYERRFGPQSVRLNVAEIGLNYVAQYVPPFRPSADGWPSPLELVASYVPHYVTRRPGQLVPWTVLEGGVRVYIFNEAWGRPGVAGLLRPAHVSFGVALANDIEGALGEPWRGDGRLGGFLAWGPAKIAVVGGRGPSVLVSSQMQIIPWLF